MTKGLLIAALLALSAGGASAADATAGHRALAFAIGEANYLDMNCAQWRLELEALNKVLVADEMPPAKIEDGRWLTFSDKTLANVVRYGFSAANDAFAELGVRGVCYQLKVMFGDEGVIAASVLKPGN